MSGDVILTDQVLEELAKSLDISPTDYLRAVDSYTAVADWLNEGFALQEYPQCNFEPAIFPQGSINLGTIVRPLRDGKESDFDIDLVCELKNSAVMLPKDVKGQIGNRLKKNQIYKDKLEPEGTRCWTLNYAKSQGIGFHMDILPSISDTTPPDIKITHKDEGAELYSWKYSNPKGYAEWFRKQNKTFESFAVIQKQRLLESAYREDGETMLFEKAQDVPEQLVRTPLQRAIQILKRHRDVHFRDNRDIKPISIIVTTLAAYLYGGEKDLYNSLINMIDKLRQFSGYVENAQFKLDENIVWRNLITRFYEDGIWKWRISNPTHEKENFADRWHEDHDARAKAFFEWAEQIYKDVQMLKTSNDAVIIRQLFEKSFCWKITGEVEMRLGIKAPVISFPNVQPKSQPKPWS
jgi:hypothetical protein